MPKIQMRRDTAANWKSVNPILLAGEWALETDTKKMKIGDGTTPYNSLQYSTAEESEEWQKPADWIDIRSGAMDNSIYLLIGHSADYSTYPQFDFAAKISGGNTYDVYIDGIKQFTTASEATTSINWQTLALTSGIETTYPTNLVTHLVCITPTSYTDTFLEVKEVLGNYQNKGLLWAHFEIDYAIVNQICSSGGSQYRNPILEVVTAKNDELKFNGSASTLFWNCEKLQYVPKLDLSQLTRTNYYSLRNAQKLKKVRISAGAITIGDCLFQNAYSLTELPTLNFQVNALNVTNFLSGATNLKDTTLNFSRTPTKKLTFGGSSSKRIDGLKGVTVSSSAPFDNTTAPQLDVSYTGLSRAALVNLFKSMPYNVGYTVVGSPTISDGVVSGFSGSDFLRSSSKPLFCPNEGKIAFHYTRQSAMNQILMVCISGSYFPFRIRLLDRTIQLIWMTDSTTQATALSGTYNITEGDYYITFNFSNSVWTVKLYNSSNELLETLTSDQTNVYWPSNASYISIGAYSSTSYWQGSIDLNETYIKVNGATWFNGAATRQLDPAATNVGGVTITNGVASGFSNSKYVNIPGTFSLNQDFEMRADFTTSASFTNNGTILAGPLAYRGGFCIDSKNLRFQGRYSIGSDAYQYILSFDTVISASTNYVAKAVRNSNTLTITLYVNGVLTETKTGDLTDINFSTLSAFVIGSGGNGYLNGSVNLNNTYVIINDVKVFSGMVPMTKTCSVVGCTGTADLTADDKAIATGKGWELTVA